jgi:purine-nucleoside phosphorylase
LDNFLIISAIASEQSCFEKKIFQQGGKRIHVIPAGIGLVASALNLGKLIEKKKPRRLFFVGTCGATRESGLTLGSVAIPKIVKLIDTGAIRLKRETGMKKHLMDAYFPNIMIKEFPLELPPPIFFKQSFPYPVSMGKICANPLAITNSVKRARLLSEHGIDIENLELAAVGQLAYLLKIPATAILGVSNYLGPAAHREWLSGRQMAEKHSCLLLKQIIHSIIA